MVTILRLTLLHSMVYVREWIEFVPSCSVVYIWFECFILIYSNLWKSLKYTIVLGIVTGGSSLCEDWLDENPSTWVDNTVIFDSEEMAG